jgi:hypothetical protein
MIHTDKQYGIIISALFGGGMSNTIPCSEKGNSTHTTKRNISRSFKGILI